MLAGTGLGDEALLAQPARKQSLAKRVVDLVRAGVGEVLALEIEAKIIGGSGLLPATRGFGNASARRSAR